MIYRLEVIVDEKNIGIFERGLFISNIEYTHRNMVFSEGKQCFSIDIKDMKQLIRVADMIMYLTPEQFYEETLTKIMTNIRWFTLLRLK